MLFLLSPAKSLDYDTPAGDVPHTLPAFVPQAAELIEVLRPYSPQQIAEDPRVKEVYLGQGDAHG